jgi:hypothetical protein
MVGGQMMSGGWMGVLQYTQYGNSFDSVQLSDGDVHYFMEGSFQSDTPGQLTKHGPVSCMLHQHVSHMQACVMSTLGTRDTC